MATTTYTGSFPDGHQVSSGHTQTASLSGGGGAINVINSVIASASFVCYYDNVTFQLTATITFNDNTTVTSSNSITITIGGVQQTVNFSFSGISVEKANNIKSLSVVSPTTVSDDKILYIKAPCSVVVDYTNITKVSTPTISIGSTSTASSYVSVSWTASVNGQGNTLTGYILEYRDSSDNSSWGNWTNYGTYSTSTRSVYASLAAERNYRQFRVRATGSAGPNYYSDWSTSNAVYRIPTPSTPTNLTASPERWESGTVTLSWGASYVSGGSINGYNISYRKKSYGGSYSSWTNLANTTSLSYVYNPNLAKGDQIQYRVYAYTSEATSSYSNTVTVIRPSDYVAQNLTPVSGWYETIDRCAWTIPQVLIVDAYTSSDYCYSADNGQTWSEWVNTTDTYFDPSSVFAGITPGNYFQFKVRIRQRNGDLSEEALSDKLYKNIAPDVPEILLPYPGQQTYAANGAFYVFLSIAENVSGNEMKAEYTITNGAQWVLISDGIHGPAVIFAKLTASGSYRFRVSDSFGANAETDPIQITVTPDAFTDDPVGAGSTKIKAVHINELRDMLDSICAFYGVTPGEWSESVIAGTTSTRNFPAHIQEIRTVIEALYSTINGQGAGRVLSAPVWTAALTDVHPSATAINELRNAIKAI